MAKRKRTKINNIMHTSNVDILSKGKQIDIETDYIFENTRIVNYFDEGHFKYHKFHSSNL